MSKEDENIIAVGYGVGFKKLTETYSNVCQPKLIKLVHFRYYIKHIKY